MLIAHPAPASLPDLKTRTLLIGQGARHVLPWLRRVRIHDAQKRPYAFACSSSCGNNVAPQANSRRSRSPSRSGQPVVFLLADSGSRPTSYHLVTTNTLKYNPTYPKFVQASA